MKPYQILLFLAGVFLLLFVISHIFPEKGIPLGDNYTLKFPGTHELLETDTVKYADISTLISSSNVLTSPLESIEDSVSAKETNDSIVFLLNQDSIRQLIEPLQFQESVSGALAPFFLKADNLELSQKVLRVLHYGDSQIEADRITSYIRYRLQQQFGGGGCGLFPVVPLYGGVPSISQSYAPGWKRFTGFVRRDDAAGHNRFGALFSFSRYHGENISSRRPPVWLSFQPSPIGYSTSRKFRNVSMFANVISDSVTLVTEINDSVIHREILPPGNALRRIRWDLDETPKAVQMFVSGKGTLDVFSLSADAGWGIAMDNIPLRGSSGLEFSKTDTFFLKEMYGFMDIGLLILQFGGNIVPEMSEDYSYYERLFKRELMVIKRLLPEVPVVVIGPADMSLKLKDKYITYPSLPKVRDAMRNATFDCGYVFWDMYEAMGGENSMPAWVNANPPLAVPDFVHFNHRGARVIAEMFYNALMYEYNRWQLLSQTK